MKKKLFLIEAVFGSEYERFTALTPNGQIILESNDKDDFFMQLSGLLIDKNADSNKDQ